MVPLCTLYKRLRKVWPVEAAHAPICWMSVSLSESSPLFCLFLFQNHLYSVCFTFRVFSCVLSISLSVFSILSVSLSVFSSILSVSLSVFLCSVCFTFSLLLYSVCFTFRVFSSILSVSLSVFSSILSRFQSLLLRSVCLIFKGMLI